MTPHEQRHDERCPPTPTTGRLYACGQWYSVDTEMNKTDHFWTTILPPLTIQINVKHRVLQKGSSVLKAVKCLQRTVRRVIFRHRGKPIQQVRETYCPEGTSTRCRWRYTARIVSTPNEVEESVSMIPFPDFLTGVFVMCERANQGEPK